MVVVRLVTHMIGVSLLLNSKEFTGSFHLLLAYILQCGYFSTSTYLERHCYPLVSNSTTPP